MTTLHLETGLTTLGLALLMLEAFVPKLPRRNLAFIAIAGLTAALVILLTGGASHAPEGMSAFYVVDNLALFYKGIALVTTIAVIIISLEYAPVLTRFVTGNPERHQEAGLAEFFTLPLFVCVGLMVMASAVDLITIFVALELTTVSFYVLVAFMRRSAMSLEAGVKYLILGALSTGLLVYGFAWLYGSTGELSLANIKGSVVVWHDASAGFANNPPQGGAAALLFAVALIVAGLGFKVAAVPFQIWVPDVYQGAPTPVTAFLSVGSKAAGFIVLSRIVEAVGGTNTIIHREVETILFVIAGATILFGNLAAIRQTNFKRLLAYSSIAHAGFLVLTLACIGTAPSGFSAGSVVAFYLATYLPMTLICFIALAAARAQGLTEDISSLRGLAKKSPFIGFALTLALASLAGLPLTAGFMGKFLVFFSVILQSTPSSYGSLLIAIIGAASGFYYYFKIILALHSTAEGEVKPIKLSLISKIAVSVFIAAIIVIGVYPDSLRNALVGKPAPLVQGK